MPDHSATSLNEPPTNPRNTTSSIDNTQTDAQIAAQYMALNSTLTIRQRLTFANNLISLAEDDIQKAMNTLAQAQTTLQTVKREQSFIYEGLFASASTVRTAFNLSVNGEGDDTDFEQDHVNQRLNDGNTPDYVPDGFS